MSPNIVGGKLCGPPKQMPSGQLRREFVINPITALAFLNLSTNAGQYLLAGEDNHIKIYDVESSKCCGELAVFEAQSIHGISVAPKESTSQNILIWGGHSVRVLQKSALDAVVSGSDDGLNQKGSDEVKTPDWIFDGAISPHESGRIALLTAHNEITDAHYNAQHSAIKFGPISSPSRPVLYSGRLSWESQDDILVAAGTVFGEILVWKLYTGSESQRPSCEILHVFSGHEGSIFGLHISHAIQLEGGKGLRLLASCSDDRTIRVWDISETGKNSKDLIEDYEAKVSAARETGFGDSVESPASGRLSTRCLATAVGHASRIWQVEFPQKQPKAIDCHKIELWSFGEDATSQQWSLTLANQTLSHFGDERALLDLSSSPSQLIHQSTRSYHSGKHIWSHALAYNSANELIIATGGSDGKILLIQDSLRIVSKKDLGSIALPPITDNLATQPSEPSSVVDSAAKDHQSEATEESPPNLAPDAVKGTCDVAPKKKKAKAKVMKELIQRYDFISKDRRIAVTNHGRLLIGASDLDLSWKQLSLPHGSGAAFLSYSVVRSLSDGSAAFLGTASGKVFVYRDFHTSTVESLTTVHGKVAGIFCLLENSTRNASIPSHESPDMPPDAQQNLIQLLVTVLGSSTAYIFHFDTCSSALELTKTEVTLPLGFVVTSAALCADFLVVGSRNGVLTIFQRSTDHVSKPACSIDTKVNDAITSILPLPGDDSGCSLYFLTTNRDGMYRIYSILELDGSIEATLLHATSPPFGPIIEKACLSTNKDGTKDLILCGFRSQNFVVWNESQRREVATIECGGAHRNFIHTTLPDNPDGLRFVYTKASELYSFSQTLAPYRAIKTGTHGREVRAISSSGSYVATAAEDTTIRIWSYDCRQKTSGQNLGCLAVMEKHTTGIQTLKWYKQDYLFSSGGNKEFFVWKIGQLQSSYRGLAVVCEAVFLDRSEVGDLRIMDFDVECLEEGPDTGTQFCISMALSNSSLQTYTYSKQHGFRHLARGSYTGACLAQLRHLQADHNVLRTLTAATDGHITVWEAAGTRGSTEAQPSEYASILVTKLHQNAVKSLDIRQLNAESGTSCLVVTGGDDNALGVMHLHYNRSTGVWTVVAKAIVRPAHAATITGLAVLKCNDMNATVVSTSNDQRVKTWRLVNWQSKDMRVLLLDDQYSSVADSGDLEMIDEDRIIVGGVGLEVWDVAA